MHAGRFHISRQILIGAFLLVASLAGTKEAHGNGRFPAASQLVVDPGDPKHILVRTTFGLLQTHDGGNKWSWICDAVVGFGDYEDPAIGIGQNGALLATLQKDGLSTSFDRGCTWAREASTLRLAVPDLAVDPNDSTKAVAVVSSSTADDAGKLSYHVYLVETADAGKSWSKLGEQLPEGVLANTVQMAPSKPTRIYIGGFNVRRRASVLARTDDGGKTWVQLDAPGQNNQGPWIAAVDATNPDIVFIRLDEEINDRVLVSTDAGNSWTEIYVGAGALLGFALSPDGTRLAVGGPMDGVQVATVGEYKFSKTGSVLVQCLTWTSAGLFACGRVPDPFSIGLSTDEGRTFRRLADLEEFCPAECPGGAFADQCPERWNRIQDDLVGRPAFACPNMPPGWTVRPDPGAGSNDGGRTDGGGLQTEAGRGGCSTCAMGRRARRSSVENGDMILGVLWIHGLAVAAISRRRRRVCLRHP